MDNGMHVVRVKNRRKCNSYRGGISPSVPNAGNRDFHAGKPNVLNSPIVFSYVADRYGSSPNCSLNTARNAYATQDRVVYLYYPS